MAKVISITAQKGGEGKTTTTLALAAGLKRRGYRVLAIDFDSQANLTLAMGAESNKPTIFGVLLGEIDVEEAIQHRPFCDVIAANASLSAAEAAFPFKRKEYRLKDALQSVLDNYDYIVIDTPPGLGILSVNALTAANCIIIPAQADMFSIQGISGLSDTLSAVRQFSNPTLYIEGILLTRYNPRTKLSKGITKIAEDLALELNTKLFKTTIRENTAIKEAHSYQTSIFDYNRNSHGAIDYLNLVDEFLKTEKI